MMMTAEQSAMQSELLVWLRQVTIDLTNRIWAMDEMDIEDEIGLRFALQTVRSISNRLELKLEHNDP